MMILTAIVGCDNSEQSTQLTKAERDSLRRIDSAALKIGVLPTEDCLPFMVAKELRLFDTLNVDVHLRKYRAMSECRKALTDSLVEGAVIDSLLLTQLNGNSPWLYAGMETSMSWQLLTAKKARITRLEQLADKMIATDSHGESHRMAEQAIDSLTRKKQQAFIIQVEDLKVRTNMLTTGNVDAALLPEPYASKAIKDGAKPIKSIKPQHSGVIAFRTQGMKGDARKKQYDLFKKAVNIANDSIKRYGKDHYMHLMEW